MKKQKPEPVIPARPACQSCGAPADVMFSFAMSELELTMAHGLPPKWTKSYGAQGTYIQGCLCHACAGNSVKINIGATLNLAGEKES